MEIKLLYQKITRHCLNVVTIMKSEDALMKEHGRTCSEKLNNSMAVCTQRKNMEELVQKQLNDRTWKLVHNQIKHINTVHFTHTHAYARVKNRTVILLSAGSDEAEESQGSDPQSDSGCCYASGYKA